MEDGVRSEVTNQVYELVVVIASLHLHLRRAVDPWRHPYHPEEKLQELEECK